MNGLDLAASALLTLLLHSTLLFGLVWIAEKARLLRHPGWAELAWRAALFGALLSTTLQTTGWLLATAATPAVVAVAPATDANVAVNSVVVAETANNVADQAGNVGADATPAPAIAAPAAAPTVTQAAPAAARGRVVLTRPLHLPLPDLLAGALLLTWAGFVAIAGLRLGRQAAALRRLAIATAAQGLAASPSLQSEAARLAASLNLPAPALRIVAGLASPLLLPDATLLLPAWAPDLPADQRRALLAHELAHLQRRDPAWRLLTRVAALPLAAHPLARHALSRLDALAEDACDARAAALLGGGRPLAECLATCLAHADHRVGSPALAVAMAGEPGAVVRRVTNLLKESTMSIRPLSPAMRRGALVLAIVAALTLPGLAITTVASEAIASAIDDGIFFGDSFSGVGNTQTYRTSDFTGSLRVTLRGDVVFNADESDIASLGGNSSFEIDEKRGDVHHWLRVRNVDGKLVREFEVDGDPQPWASTGRTWFAQRLPTLLRETGIDAENRGKRILARGGVPALLDEIALIGTDYGIRIYLDVLFANGQLDDAQLQKAFVQAARIGSDFELRNALQAAVGTQTMTAPRQVQLLEAAAALDSDFELAELLSTVAEEWPLDGAVLPAWRAALASMGSDFEIGRVLEKLLDRSDVHGAGVVVALESADGIGSDFELREVLEQAAPHVRGNAAALAAWLARADSLGSDFERRTALVALLQAGDVDAALADGVLTSVAGIDSDFEAGQVLAELAERMPNDAALIERYRAQARRLGDHERGQAEKALDRFAAN